jgi:beta-glucosidase
MKNAIPENSIMHSTAFTYGVATSSFQIEGATQVDGRLPSIWDAFCNTEGKIKDNSNGDIACDHYHLWQEDIDLIVSLGVDAYRFSIAWPRMIKANGELNQAGADFYLKILNYLKTKNIKAFVTLYHWDLPQHLEEKGGWLNRETAYLFQDYVAKTVNVFGDLVFSYATLNEPFCSAYLGYEAGIHAPGLKNINFGKKAAHHLLLAHGLAMQTLRKLSPNTENGIVLNFTPCYPLTNSEADKQAADYSDQYFNQWYIKPLFDRCYPDIIKQLPEAQQPDIQAGDFDIIATPIDFLGVNFYTRAVYQAIDNDIIEVPPIDVPITDIGWEIYPAALTELLVSLKQKYKLPPVYITENGMAVADKIIDGEVDDIERVDYYQQHLRSVAKAIEQGVNVQGYFAWSLMDNFEWAEGYSKRFGIVYVDYEIQKRTLKTSALKYKALVTSRC